jgi:putative oxidoreductase
MNSTFAKVLRYLLAFIMLVFGANKFLDFMPKLPLPPDAVAFMGALDVSGYIFPIVGIVYILAGFCLVLNKSVPFALAMIVPISINIVAFHFRFYPEGIAPAALVAVLNILLIYANWGRFKSLFS